MAVSRWGAVVAGGVAVALIAGVVVDGSAAGASTGSRKAASYSVDKAGAVHGAKHQAPGRVVIKVKGHKGESQQLVRSRHGAGKGTLLVDAGKLNSTGDASALEHDFVLAGGTTVGHTLYVTLKRGTYYAIDTNNDAPKASQIKRIRVSGKRKNAKKPKLTGTITAIKSTTWSKKPKSMKHVGVLAFANKSKQAHFLVLARMKKGTTAKDIVPALTGKVTPSTVFYSGPKNEFDTGVIAPHSSMKTSYKLPKGQYAVMCFWPDPMTHMPHAFMGMVRTIRLK